MSHLDDALCEAIVSKLLDREELAEVGDHIATCPDCEALLRDRMAETERIRSRPVPNLALPIRERESGAPIQGRRWLLGGAGLAAAAAAALLLLWPSPPGQETYWMPLDDLVSLRGNATPEMIRGIEAYRSRDLGTAEEALAKVVSGGEPHPLAHLLLAGAYWNQGRADAARTQIDHIDRAQLPQPWREHAGWLTVLILEAEGRDREADQELHRLATGTGSLAERARKRLADR